MVTLKGHSMISFQKFLKPLRGESLVRHIVFVWEYVTHHMSRMIIVRVNYSILAGASGLFPFSGRLAECFHISYEV